MSVSTPPWYRKPYDECTSIGTCVIDGETWDLWTFVTGSMGITHVVARCGNRIDYASLVDCMMKRGRGTPPHIQYAYIRAKNLGLISRESEE